MKLVTTKEVATEQNVTVKTVSNWVRSGRLKPFYTHHKFFLFDAKDLEGFTFKTQSKCNK